MSAKNWVVGLCGLMAFGLVGCAEADLQRETEMSDLRRQVELLRIQYTAKDKEAKRLAVDLATAKQLEGQVSDLEERLRGMQDIILAKDEQIGRLQAQLEAAQKAATQKKATKKAKPTAPAKGADAAAKGKDTP